MNFIFTTKSQKVQYIAKHFLVCFSVLSAFVATIFFSSNPVHAQITITPNVVTDRQLADQYFNSGEFDKAAVLYDKLFDKDPWSVYPNYLRTLINLKNYND